MPRYTVTTSYPFAGCNMEDELECEEHELNQILEDMWHEACSDISVTAEPLDEEE